MPQGNNRNLPFDRGRKENNVPHCKCGRSGLYKTSTGFSNAGATHDDIKLLKARVSVRKIKAAGGIHTLEDAAEFLSEGADRLGTSAIVGIAEKELDEN